MGDKQVVGGGDGGVATECMRHAGMVQSIVVVDIDPQVTQQSATAPAATTDCSAVR